MPKIFERAEYQQNYPWARQRAKLLLDQYEWGDIEIQPERSNADLILRRSNRTFGIEAQIKKITRTWKHVPNNRFVDIEKRRNKEYHLETLFLVLVCMNYNAETNPRQNEYAWMIHQRSIKPDRLFQKHTNKEHLLVGETQEWFYSIPVAECRLLRFPGKQDSWLPLDRSFPFE